MTNARMMIDLRAAFQASNSKTMQEKAKYWIPHKYLATDNQIKRPNVSKTFSY